MPEICLIQPAGEPIHVEEVKLDRRIVSDNSDDSRIRSLIAAARQHAEMQTRLQLLHARWQLALDGFPMYGSLAPFSRPAGIPEFAIMLPHSPLVKVVSIQYVDMGGVQQTMDPADYVVNKVNTPALITPKFGKIWPIPLPQIGSVTVTYDAGFASPVTFSQSGSQLSVTGPVEWAVGDRVQLYGSGTSDYAMPTPLNQDAAYLIATAPGNGVYTLSDLVGNPITFSDAGAGTGRAYLGVVPDGIRAWMMLRVGAMYENREEVAVGQRVVVLDLPYVDGLLDPYRTSLP
jgi:uncharacterized phiE125 gp8 family phage protein